MKYNLLKSLLIGAVALMLPLHAEAASTFCLQNIQGQSSTPTVQTAGGTTYTPSSNGVLCGVAPSDVGGVEKAGFGQRGTTDLNVAFSTLPPNNPMTMFSNTTVVPGTAFNSATTATVLQSTASRALSIFNPTIMVSGTAGGATGLALECSGGTLIAQWPIADLVDQKPVSLGLYLSTLGTITTGAGLAQGCPAGQAVYLSSVGNALTTTTLIYLSLPHTIQ